MGQEHRLDSLRQIYEQTTGNGARLKAKADLAKAYSGNDSVQAYTLAHEVLAEAGRGADPLLLAIAESVLGYVEYDYGNMDLAVRHYGKAKELLDPVMDDGADKEVVDLWLDSTMNLGASYANLGHTDIELEYYLEAAPIAKKAGNYKVAAIINSNIGLNFFNEGDYQKAYPYFQGNDLLYERSGTKPQYAQDRLLFAGMLMDMDSLDRAVQELDKAERLLNKMPQAQQRQIFHNIKGNYFAAKGLYRAALKEYDKGMQILDRTGQPHLQKQLLLDYARVYGAMGDRASQRRYLLRFRELVSDTNDPLTLMAMRELFDLDLKDEHYKEAALGAQVYFELNDSVREQELKKETTRLERRYESERKERKILELQNANNEAALVLEQKRSQTYLLSLLLGALVTVSSIGYLTYRNRQKKTALREQAKDRELQQLKADQDRKLFGVMMEGVEQERKRLAVDLHDGLGGRLSGIGLKLSRLSGDRNAREVKPQVQEILDNLNGSLHELRGVARNLMPETLLNFGLEAALKDYCIAMKQEHVDIVLQYYGKTNLDNKNTALTIYRIVQELINNAVKHAEAKEILVQYLADEDRIAITVEDNGKGMDPQRLWDSTGMGLANLRNRVAYLNGEMEVISSPDEGTTVNIQITPIPA